MLKNHKKLALQIATALGLAIGAAGNVSAITAGTLTDPNNDGISPIYADTTVDGYFGGQLYLVGGPATIDIDFLGNEAGFNNTFTFGGNNIFSTNDYANDTWGVALDSDSAFPVSSGLLDFCFTTSGPGGTVCNGVNPDGSGGGGGVNWFVTFGNTTDTYGTVVELWLDDGGAGPDDNHDDMAIRLTVTGGGFEVPIPAAVWLFGSGLIGLVGIARRKKAA